MTTPHFHNPDGYSLRMIPGTRKFEFTLSPIAPLTWVDESGREWQPDRHYVTDLGSIPRIVSWVPGYEPSRLAFLFHDSAYVPVPGRGHGLYARMNDFHHAAFASLTRAQADDLMRQMLISEGVRSSAARVIWAAVRAFGPRW